MQQFSSVHSHQINDMQATSLYSLMFESRAICTRVCVWFLENMFNNWVNFLALLLLTGIETVTSHTIKNSSSSSPRQRLVGLAGSEEWLEYDLYFLKKHARELRNGTLCDLGEKWFQGFHGVVAPVNFADGTKWAVKISENSEHFIRAATLGYNCTRLLENYCPEIPFARSKGNIETTKSGKLIYQFMDWIDGIPLYRDPSYQMHRVLQSENQANTESWHDARISISDITVKQLARFVYNLTKCPIPLDKRTTSPQSRHWRCSGCFSCRNNTSTLKLDN